MNEEGRIVEAKDLTRYGWGRGGSCWVNQNQGCMQKSYEKPVASILISN